MRVCHVLDSGKRQKTKISDVSLRNTKRAEREVSPRSTSILSSEVDPIRRAKKKAIRLFSNAFQLCTRQDQNFSYRE